MSNSQQKLTTIYQKLEAHGHRLTTARRTIIAVLLAQSEHLTADALAELVRQQDTGIGRMTVYRTLDLLGELGVVRPVYQGTGAAHYVLLDDGHHHHLICGNCDQVIEFEDCVVEEIADVVSGRFNFHIQGHLLEFYGLCADCQTQ